MVDVCSKVRIHGYICQYMYSTCAPRFTPYFDTIIVRIVISYLCLTSGDNEGHAMDATCKMRSAPGVQFKPSWLFQLC